MVKKRQELNALGEFGLINLIQKRFIPKNKTHLLKGIGDDTAAIRVNSGKALLFTTDMMVEDVHFSLKYEDFFSIGWKALAINISDIASMGGIPTWGVVSIGIPVSMSVDNVDNIAKGMSAIAKKYHVDIIGGDTVKADKLVLNVALLGEVSAKDITYRHGADPGDSLFVTGKLGESAAGLRILQNKNHQKNEEFKRWKEVINHYLRPEPRLKEAALIVREKLASSMIDISDGLLLSVKFLCEQSRVGCRIYADKLPLNYSLSSSNYNRALQLALSGGEDYELLFTAPANKKKKALEFFPHGYIGDIISSSGIIVIDKNGQEVTVKAQGYEHFKK